MAEQSGFFNANLVNGAYDRVYLAESFAKYFASFVGNGIFSGKLSELLVVQPVNSGMKVEVLPGMGWINGYWYENTSNLSLAIDIADGVLNRIDCVVLRWSRSSRSINIAIKKGSFASNPTVPSVQRDANIYELKIAEIYVKAGATSIVQSNIKDTRLDTKVCGLVTGLLKQFDTDEFTGLIRSAFNEVSVKTSNEINSVLEKLKDVVEDENAFAGLVLEVNDILSKVTLLSQTLGFSKKNLIPYPYRNTSTTVNGVTFTDNGDGTITANGKPTGVVTYQLSNIKLDPSKKYFLTDGVDAGQDTYYTQLYSADAKFLPASSAAGQVEFTPEDVTYVVRLVIKTEVSNLVFKPMIRRAEILDSTWEPYRLSVDEIIKEDEVEKGCFYRINRFTGIKEWLNAPSIPGVEYCLTERWDNKPVYQKTFFVSALPNKSMVGLITNTQWNRVVSISGYALNSDDLSYYPFPITLRDQVVPIAVINEIESDGALTITTSTDASHLKAYITVKYTKQ